MAPRVAPSDVVLPPIRTLFPHSTFQSFPTSDEAMPIMPLREKQPPSQRQFNPLSQQKFPFAAPKRLQQGRRVSTDSTCSSVPSLTFSPSPSPTPSPTSTRSPSSQRFRLVPCSIKVADVVVAEPPSQTSTSNSSSASSSGQYSTRSTNNRAVLLVGDAISVAAKDKRKLRPYRVLRERGSE